MARADFNCRVCTAVFELALVDGNPVRGWTCEECGNRLSRQYTPPSFSVDAATGGRRIR